PLAFLLPSFPLPVVRKAFRTALPIEAKYDAGHAIQEVAVMRDQHERTAEFEQAFFEDFQGGDVEVVGGLIQQKNVGGLKHELSNQHTGAFASGKPLDGLVELFATEQEFGGPGCDVNDAILIDDGVPFGSECTAQGQAQIELAALVE